MLDKLVSSTTDCEKLGKSISKYLNGGDVVSFEGDLGSGKTTFIKGILKGFNYMEDVTSPTFTLVNEYDASIKIIHIDFYREPNINRWHNLGFNDYLKADYIILIEWGNLIPELLPNNTKHIYFEHIDVNKRRIHSRYVFALDCCAIMSQCF